MLTLSAHLPYRSDFFVDYVGTFVHTDKLAAITKGPADALLPWVGEADLGGSSWACMALTLNMAMKNCF